MLPPRWLGTAQQLSGKKPPRVRLWRHDLQPGSAALPSSSPFQAVVTPRDHAQKTRRASSARRSIMYALCCTSTVHTVVWLGLGLGWGRPDATRRERTRRQPCTNKSHAFVGHHCSVPPLLKQFAYCGVSKKETDHGRIHSDTGIQEVQIRLESTPFYNLLCRRWCIKDRASGLCRARVRRDKCARSSVCSCR